MHMDMDLMILPLAFALDLVLGDPLWLPHPIVWMGNAISGSEKLFRRWIKKSGCPGCCLPFFSSVPPGALPGWQ